MNRKLSASLSALALCAGLSACNAAAHESVGTAEFRNRPPADEVVYFVLPDRFANGDTANDTGGVDGERLDHGFDPTNKGFYHGGDLKGLTEKLDYIAGMGATAIWFAPIFKNKPVQGPEGGESAGYHGYWVTDFTQVDPHFGTNEEFKAFVDAAHARGMKVYMDIITNHTADVIGYAEGAETGYKYRSRAAFPESRKMGVDGAPINDGFEGVEVSTAENFAKLIDPAYAYTPVIPEAEKDIKVPAWLNNPKYYHNRGDTTFTGESSRLGDFAGLDDVMTEEPFVRNGMIEIYARWITDFGIDGFRIDTARHVDPGFWNQFVPAMLQTARAEGIPNFHIFGEVYKDSSDNGYIAQYTRRDGFPAILDFAFQNAVREVVAQDKGTYIFNELFDGDVLYEGGEEAALGMPTFVGNHDMGRFTTQVKGDRPGVSQEELLARTTLAHTMLMLLRGSPVIYYGSEQGFVGDGNDQAAREDMFPSVTGSYNDNVLIGTDATTADANFDTAHPLYVAIAALAKLRKEHPALARGRQMVRGYEQEAGLFSVSRFDPKEGTEYLIAFNTSDKPISTYSAFGYNAVVLESLMGDCGTTVAAPGSIKLEIPAFGAAICRAASRGK